MAGEWIKMRSDLLTHPKVVRIMSALKADKLRVIGGLHAVWSLFDTHSVDGTLDGYTFDVLDNHLGWPGFAFEMSRVNWLIENPESLTTPEFDTHNGQSAKRRAQDADRKKDVRNASASEADKKRTREEKRREDSSVAKATADDVGATTGEPFIPEVVKPMITDPGEIIFGYGLSMLVNAGTTEKQGRSFLGGLRKHHGDSALIDKLRECAKAKPLQPLEWLAAALPPGGAPPKPSAPESFKQSDARIGRARWEEMTGRTHPDNLISETKHGGMVVDVTPRTLEIQQ